MRSRNWSRTLTERSGGNGAVAVFMACYDCFFVQSMPRASKQQARYAVGRCLMSWSSNDVTQQGSRPKTKLAILWSLMLLYKMCDNQNYGVTYMKFLLAFSLLIPSVVFASSSKFQQVEQDVKAIEVSLSARIGVSVLDTQNGEYWDYNGNQRFPLTSTFKTIACAKLLYDAEQGKVNPNSTVEIKKADLVTYSPVIEKQVGQAITLDDACFATMTTSDNTAANIILSAVGGPKGVTDFLRQIGDKETRLDRIEPDLNEGKLGDLRDTTTPKAIASTLNKFLFGSALSEMNQKKLESWMVNNQVTGNLLRSVLPAGWNIADRSGAGGFGARSITAVVWSEHQAPIIVSIYLAQTQASMAERNDAIVKIGHSIFDVYTSQSR